MFSLTPSYSLTSPGISNWTVNEGSQTTQTGGYWDRGDSFDSSKSYSLHSTNLEKHHRSRSVPSIRCIVCRQTQSSHNSGMRVSESMNYGSRIHHGEFFFSFNFLIERIIEFLCMCHFRSTTKVSWFITGLETPLCLSKIRWSIIE